MSVIEERLIDAKSKLESDKVKSRKDGVKLLFTLLDGEQALQLLDSETARLWPDEQCKKVTSWPRVLRFFIEFTERELLMGCGGSSASGSRSRSARGGGGGGGAGASSTSRQPSEAANLLRRLVAIADDVQRSGRRGNLQLWVWRLWHHVAKMLDEPGLLQSELAAPYLALLSRHLLAAPEYTRYLDPVTAHSLLTSICSATEGLAATHARAESATAGVTAQLQSYLGVLTSLLAVLPGDLLDEQRQSLQGALKKSARWLAKIRDTGKSALSWFGCALQLLVAGGLDALGVLPPQLHAAVRPLMRLAWRDDRTPRLKETMTRYCLLQLQLGGLDHPPDGGGDGAAGTTGSGSNRGGVEALVEVYDMALRDVSYDLAKWELDSEDGSISPLALIQLQLLAALFYAMQQAHSAGRLRPEQLTHGSGGAGGDGKSASAALVIPDSDDDDGDDDDGEAFGRRRFTAPPPAKRRRQLPPFEWLLDQCALAPSRWAPVLAVLLHHHGYHLPAAFHSAALHQVLACLRSLVPFAAGAVSASHLPAGGAAAASQNGGAAGAQAAAAAAAAATALLRPEDLAAKQLGAAWCLRCLEVLAEQQVYPASQTHGSRFFGCGFSAASASSSSGGVSSSEGGGSASPSGRDAVAVAAATAAAWQSAAELIAVRIAGRNLLIPPTQGLPNALQAEALWALAAVLRVRRAGGGGGAAAIIASKPYVVRPPPGLLQTVVAVMQTSLPADDTNTAAAADGGTSRTVSVPASVAATTPTARSYIWQAAAATVVAALNAAPAADSTAVAACQAAAATCQPAVLRLAITPPNHLLHELLGAASGSSSAATYGPHGAGFGATAAAAPPLPALPLDLAPEQHPHPYTRLPRWCPNDSETTAFCCKFLAVQRRATELMAWQEARERAYRHMTHGSVLWDSGASAAAGTEAVAAGRRLMGRIAVAALSRVRNLVLDMADSGGGEEADVARLIGCGQLLLSATLHGQALRAGDAQRGEEAVAGFSQPHSQPLRGASSGDGDPWVAPAQAWEALSKAVASAVRPALGEGSGGGGGGGGGSGGGAAMTTAAPRAGGPGMETRILQTSLESLLSGMKVLQDLLEGQLPAGSATSQPSRAAQSPASLAPALASLEAVLQRHVTALRRVVEPTAAASAGSAGVAVGGSGGMMAWQPEGVHGADGDDDDEEFGGRRRGVARGRLGTGGATGTAGGGAGGGGGGVGGATAAATQLGGAAAGTQMLTGPGMPTAVATGSSPHEVALAGALRAAELLEAFAPLCSSSVSQVVSRTLVSLMQRRQQLQPGRQGQQSGSGGGGADYDFMEVDEDEIEDADDGSDGSEGAGGGGGAYGSGGRSAAAQGSRRGAQLAAPTPPEELVAALGQVAVSAAIAAGTAAATAVVAARSGMSSPTTAAAGAAGGTSGAERRMVVVGSACSDNSAAPDGGGGGGGDAARSALSAALAALGPDVGLLSLRYVRYEEPRATASGQPSYKIRSREVSEHQMVAVAIQLRRLARHLGTTVANRGAAAAAGGGSGEGAANAAGLEDLLAGGGVQVLREALQSIDEAFNANDFVPYSWQLRAAVAALTAELLPLDTPRFSPGMPQYDMSDLVGSLRLLPCWQEPSYRARRTGATLTRILFRRFTAHDRLLEELDLPQLAGDGAAAATAAPAPEPRTLSCSLAETAALSYVELLQVSSKLEVVVARRLLAHAAMCRRDEGVVAACLRLAAARLGYSAAADYLAAIMRPLAWAWFTLYDMETLLVAAPILVDGTAAADPWVSEGATADPRVVFLRRNQGSVLLPLVIGDLQQPATAMASLLGAKLPGLLSEHVPYIFGTLLLLQAAGQGRWLEEVARNRLVSGNLDVEGDVDRQLSNRTYLFLANMLLDVVPEGEAAARPQPAGSAPREELPPLPTFSAETCCRAVLDIPGLPSRAENESFLWSSLLPPHSVAWAAAALHEALAGGAGSDGGGGSSRRGGGGEGPTERAGAGVAAGAAAAPRHRACRLAGLGALMRLLGPRAAEPATGRYLAYILMQQLREPALQPAVCGLLHGLLGTMGLGIVQATHGSGAAAALAVLPTPLEQPPLAATVPEADQLAVLGELLPPLVSALAEALEAAEAGADVVSKSTAPWVPFGLPLPSAAALTVAASDGSAVAGLDPCLQSYSDATEYSPVTGLDERTAVVRAGGPALVGLLLRLALGSPPEVAAGLATCRLLPELPELREAVELQQRLRSRVSLPEQLAHLSAVVQRGARGGGGGLGPGARARLVAAVRADVEARWSELLVQDDEGTAAGDGTCRGELLPSAAASAWELAAAAAELDDPALSELAATLLAASGLRDPRAPPPPQGLTAEGSDLPGSNKGRFASSAPVTQMTAPSVATAAGTAAGGRTSRRTGTIAPAAPSVAANGGRRSSRRSGTAAAEASGALQGGAAASTAADAGGGGTAAAAAVCDNWLVSVLQLMAEQYLVSDDPMLIVECQSTAIQLLALPAGREALEALGPDSHTHRHLRIYLSSSTQQPQQQQPQLQGREGGGTGDGGGDGGAAPEDLIAAVPERLWCVPSPAAGGADSWLRRLTPALLDIVTDPALKLMRGLAGLQAAVCEALFPALLQHLATAGAARDPCLPANLARLIQKHVLLPQQQTRGAQATVPLQRQQQPAPPGKGSALALVPRGAAAAVAPPPSAQGDDGEDPWVGGDLRAVQIILRSLEHLQRLHLRVVSGRKPGQTSSKAAVDAGGQDGWESAVDCWEYVYGLEVDYLAVARAAIRCRQPATAMIYVGHWAEKAAAAVRVAHRLHADRQQAAAAAAAGGKGGGGTRQSGSSRQQRGASSPPASPTAEEGAQTTAFENAAVQGGVYAALQVLPPCRPQPPKGTTDALSVALDAYGSIDDPDALYALPSTYMLIGNGGGGAAGGSAAGAPAAPSWGGGGGGGHPKGHELEMHLFEREGMWPQALSGHDLELRPTAGRTYGNWLDGGGGGVAGGRSTAVAAAGIVSALRNLGGNVTAQLFLAGLAAAAPGGLGALPSGAAAGGGASLPELQYELSWRLSTWAPLASGAAARVQLPTRPCTRLGASPPAGCSLNSSNSSGGGDDGSSTSCYGGGGGGFHEAVYRSLAALAAADRAQVESLLSTASHAAVCRLAAKSGPAGARTSGAGGGAAVAHQAYGTEGGGGAVSCLVEMRMLAALRDACQLAGSAAPPSAAVRGMLLPLNDSRAGSDPWVSVDSLDRTTALEPLLALRCAALAAVGRPREQADALVAVVQAARRSGATASGLAAVQELRALLSAQASAEWVTDLRCGGGAAWRLDEARLVRRRGQTTLAAHMTLALVSELEQQHQQSSVTAVAVMSEKRGSNRSSSSGGGGCSGGALQLATALSLAGSWCAEAQVDCGAYGGVMGLMGRAADIAVQALGGKMVGGAGTAEGAAAAAPTWESQAACKVLYRLAAYADQRYREVVAVLQSPEHVKRMSVVTAKRREADGIRAKKDAASGQMKQWLEVQLRRVLSPVLADEEADAALRSAQSALRSTAVANYGRCLSAGTRHDLAAVYRLCQMWLQPSDGEDISAAFAQASAAVPSYKWLPLVYQMASRLSAAPPPASVAGAAADSFQRVLQSLLLRLATDHPYHVVYQLFALRNGNLDRAGRPQSSSDNTGFVQVVDVSKIKAAEMLLQQLLAKGGRVAVIVKQAEKLVRMYVDLAAIPPPQEESPQPQPFPTNLKRQVDGGAMDALPVVSSLTPVDPTAGYEGLPHLVGFDPSVSYAGGINKPKIIVANDSSGAKHKQLVKSGNDDLRQDAVMQQTFALINGLLARDAAAARRGLRIATYRVVPFSPTAGLLQWVENTQPLNMYLLGKNYSGGAHGRYMPPGEWTWMQCYNHIRTATDAGRKGGVDAAELLLRAFEECFRRFSPCLHHFLLEAFPSPPAWLAAQSAYTRSTAATSMAGYLLGLGDRHSGNILLHGATGEVVHIDLGIAFEQGRFLVTPELVPFRLTRDVVDGMGVNGVEGPFRRSCEETLRVLRSNAEMLLTVLEVVLYDPMHKWSLTLAKARQKQPRARGGGGGEQQQQLQEQQNDDDDPVALLGNADAARAVLRVKQKLEGRLDAGGLGRASATSGGAAAQAGALPAAGKAAAAAAAAAATGASMTTTTGAAALAVAAAAAAADAGGAPVNVEGQVRALLAEAQDPHRLSRMYVGWSAWM